MIRIIIVMLCIGLMGCSYLNPTEQLKKNDCIFDKKRGDIYKVVAVGIFSTIAKNKFRTLLFINKNVDSDFKEGNLYRIDCDQTLLKYIK